MKGTLVEALDHGRGLVGEEGAEQPGHEVGAEVGDVAVDEGDQVTCGLTERHPHGLALATTSRVTSDHAGTGLLGDGSGPIGGAVVDDDHLVYQGDAAPGLRQLRDDRPNDGADRGGLVAGGDAHRDRAPIFG